MSNIVGKIQKYYGQKNLGSFKAKSHLPLLFFFAEIVVLARKSLQLVDEIHKLSIVT